MVTLKKATLPTLLGFVIFLSFVSPFASASSYDREVARVATIISQETRETMVRRQIPLPDLLDLSRHIVSLSRSYQLDPLLILAIIKVESGFRTAARSPSGAIGLMQVMPIVIREVGEEVSVKKKEELYDPYKNLHLGIHYLTFLLDKYRNNLQHALVAYNLGPSALDERLSQRGFVPLDYYRKVMASYRSLQERIQTLIWIA